MIEIEMPGDIFEFEPKLIGNFTVRQCACFSIGAVGAFIPYNLLNGSDLSILIILFTAGLPILCGIKKFNNMPAEKFLLMYIKTILLPPKIRKYKTNNLFDECIEEKKSDEYKKFILESRKKRKRNQRSKNEDIMEFK